MADIEARTRGAAVTAFQKILADDPANPRSFTALLKQIQGFNVKFKSPDYKPTEEVRGARAKNLMIEQVRVILNKELMLIDVSLAEVDKRFGGGFMAHIGKAQKVAKE